MTDSTYLAVALAVFVVSGAIQLGIYRWLLAGALRQEDVARARAAFIRWIAVALGYQTVVLVLAGGYMIAKARGHPAGFAWVAPALAALLGTALPLQLVVASALRAARR